jgi:hypothetical protein
LRQHLPYLSMSPYVYTQLLAQRTARLTLLTY